MQTLSLKLLGGFSLTAAGGRRITIRRKKAQALLACLALSPGQAQGRDRLAGLLWGDRPDADARMNLRQTLRALRRDLGTAAQALEATAQTIALRSGSVLVDVDALARVLNRDGASAADLAAAYPGPLLDAFVLDEEEFDRWLDHRRTVLAQRVLAGLRTRLDAAAASGDLRAASDAAGHVLAIDPADEPAHRQLIRHYLAAGQRDRATQQLLACRRALREDLDLSPSPETERLLAPHARATARGRTIRAPTRATRLAVRTVQPAAHADPALRAELLQALSRWHSFATLEDPAGAGEYHLTLRVRADAQGATHTAAVALVDTDSGCLAWAERFEAPAPDRAWLVARVAQAVASQIDCLRATTAGGDVAEALLRRAAACHLSRTRNGTLKARRLFLDALRHGADEARALDGFAGATVYAVSQGWLTPRRKYADLAAAAVARAVECAPRDAAPRVTQSCICLHIGDFDHALAEAERAIDLNPANAFALAHRAIAYQGIGDICRAVDGLATARQLAPPADPRSQAIHVWLARALLGSGDASRAAGIAAPQLRRMPDYGPAYVALASGLLQSGDSAAAARVVARCRNRLPGFIEHRRGYSECRDPALDRHLNAAIFSDLATGAAARSRPDAGGR